MFDFKNVVTLKSGS